MPNRGAKRKRERDNASGSAKRPVGRTAVREGTVATVVDICAALPLGASGFLNAFADGAPGGEAGFLRKHWRKRALATHAPPSRLAPILADLLWSADVGGMPPTEAQRTAEHHAAASRLPEGEVLSALLEATPSPTTSVWMPARASAAVVATAATEASVAAATAEAAAPRLNSISVDDARSALACYAAGNSLYFSAPDAFVHRYVRAAARDAGMACAGHEPDGGARGQVEVFAARAGHVTDWHFDFMDNFTVQLSGTKRWRLRHNSGVAHPLRGATPHYASGGGTWEQQVLLHRLADPAFQFDLSRNSDFELGGTAAAGAPNPNPHAGAASSSSSSSSAAAAADHREQVIVLRPGSVLYHPAGVWHRVECTEDSLAINISLVHTRTFADVACDGLRQLLWRDAKWRQGVSNSEHVLGAAGLMEDSAGQQQPAQAALATLLRQLPELASELRAPQLLPLALLDPQLRQGAPFGSTQPLEPPAAYERPVPTVAGAASEASLATVPDADAEAEEGDSADWCFRGRGIFALDAASLQEVLARPCCCGLPEVGEIHAGKLSINPAACLMRQSDLPIDGAEVPLALPSRPMLVREEGSEAEEEEEEEEEDQEGGEGEQRDGAAADGSKDSPHSDAGSDSEVSSSGDGAEALDEEKRAELLSERGWRSYVLHVGVGSGGLEFDSLMRTELLCPPAYQPMMEFVADRAMEVGSASSASASTTDSSAAARRARFSLKDLEVIDSGGHANAAHMLVDALLYFGVLAFEQGHD